MASIGEFVYKFFYWILGGFFLISFIALFFVVRAHLKRVRNRLLVRIRETERNLSEYFATIQDKFFERKEGIDKKPAKYHLNKEAIYFRLFKSKMVPAIDFIAGIEKPFIAWVDQAKAKGTLNFMGSEALDATFEQKMIVEMADLGQKKGMDTKTIMMIIGGIVIIGVIAYFLLSGKNPMTGVGK